MSAVNAHSDERNPRVLGPVIDEQTRCVHYASALDVIAIRFACCGEFYPCHLCHAEAADHDSRPWGAGHDDTLAVLCGACWSQLMICEYHAVDACPRCGAGFNPGCSLHDDIYFG